MARGGADAATGETLFDLPRHICSRRRGPKADGKAQLFVTRTDGVLVPSFGEIQLLDLRAVTPAIAWSRTNAAWISADLPRMGATWSTSASQGMRHVLVCQTGPDKQPCLLVAQRNSGRESFSTSLTSMRARKDDGLEKSLASFGLPGDIDASHFRHWAMVLAP